MNSRIGAKAGRKTTPAHKIGLLAFLLAIGFGLIDYRLAAVPLAIFVLLCLIAPLLPGIGFFLPVISRGRPGKNAVALTFDDGPNPSSTPELLDLLSRRGIPATFFVNGDRTARHPEIIREILARGHVLGNHTYRHDNFIMLKRSRTLLKEIVKTQEVLEPFGVTPLAFRPPVGVTSPRLGKVLRETGLFVVNFNRRGGDRGNRRVKGISKRILKRLRDGDIIMLHDTPPRGGNRREEWLREVDRLLSGIEARELHVVSLSKLIDRTVMRENMLIRTRRKDAIESTVWTHSR